MELTDNDRQRIEQESIGRYLAYYGDGAKCFREGAEYATRYEREQQATMLKENENLKQASWEKYSGREERIKELDEKWVSTSVELVKTKVKINQLEAERSEVRNKVIEECIEKVRYSYNLSLGATDTVVELLNSLKK